MRRLAVVVDAVLYVFALRLTVVRACVSLNAACKTIHAGDVASEPRRENLVASLFVIQGADQGKRFEFTSGPVALGRDDSNAVRLHDTEVSRRHAELRLEQGGYRILDLSSANGTFVNGQPVDQTALSSGDRVQLGQTVLLFHEGSEPRAAT